MTSFSVNSEKPAGAPEKSKLALAKLEIVFNRLFAVLLVLFAIPLFLNIYTLPTIVICTVFACFLLFGKKYRPFAIIIFLIFAAGIYFFPITPIGWGLYHNLKESRLDGFNFYTISTLFGLAPLIFVTLAVRNVLGNILAYFKTNTVWRNVYYLISLFIVLVALLAYPLFDSVKLRERAMEDGGGNKLSFVLTKQELKHDGSSTALSRDYIARFDPASNKYVYRLYLEDPLAEYIAFTAVETDGEKINFITDGRAECLNCKKDKSNPYGLVFPTGKNIDFIIISDRLIKNIKFTETGDKAADFFFWK